MINVYTVFPKSLSLSFRPLFKNGVKLEAFIFSVGIYDSDDQARALNHLIKKLPDAVVHVMKYLFKFLSA